MKTLKSRFSVTWLLPRQKIEVYREQGTAEQLSDRCQIPFIFMPSLFQSLSCLRIISDCRFIVINSAFLIMGMYLSEVI